MKIQNVEVFSHLMQLVYALDDISPNRFLDMINDALTAGEVYDAVRGLGYAANSKELRDGADEEVHRLCEEIRLQARKLDDLFNITLSPNSPQQKQSWEHFVFRSVGGKYAFQADGSLEISLLHAELRDSKLGVRRTWGRSGSHDKSPIDFQIKLDANQVSDFKRKLAALRSIQAAILEVIKDLRLRRAGRI
jgi:hypothetical protein